MFGTLHRMQHKHLSSPNIKGGLFHQVMWLMWEGLEVPLHTLT